MRIRSFGIVILAAGGSSRLGRPKQLLPYRGRTLIEHAVETARESGALEIVVVLGGNAEAIAPIVDRLDVRVTVNVDWEQGMAGSIALGIGRLSSGVEAAIIMLADQPLLTSDHLRRLVEKEGSIVASRYDNVDGVPCLFEESTFDKLRNLKGSEGARQIIRSSRHEFVELSGAHLDIDTEDDFRELMRRADI